MLKFSSAPIIQAEKPSYGGLIRTSHRASFDYTPRDGYLYVRSRAISSRCNDNFDEFPAEEIKQAYLTFVGKPVFVNHNNADHTRARGVVVDAVLHEDINPDGTDDTWVEVLMEVDAINFPQLAEGILTCMCGHVHEGQCGVCGCDNFEGQISRTSMGCDVKYSICSFCGNRAETSLDYCDHIKRMKGSRIRRRKASGTGFDDVLVSEICHDISFFENSLLVEDPADPTAYFLGVDSRGVNGGNHLTTASSSRVLGNEPAPRKRDLALSKSASAPREAASEVKWFFENGTSKEAALNKTSLGILDTLVENFGMIYDPHVARSLVAVMAAKWLAWDTVPLSTISLDDLYATEEKVSSESIEDVVKREEPLRQGYDPLVVVDEEGHKVIIDGHHRIAMAVAKGLKTIRARVLFSGASSDSSNAFKRFIFPPYRGASLTPPNREYNSLWNPIHTTATHGTAWKTKTTGMIHRTVLCPRITGDLVESVVIDDTTEQAIVEEFGANACSYCYKTAPTPRSLGVTASERKTVTGEWDEEDEALHPREQTGKFTKGQGSPRKNKEKTPKAKPAKSGQPATQTATEPEQTEQTQETEQPEQPASKPKVDLTGYKPDKKTTGTGTKEDPVKTESVEDAAAALSLGLHVELSQPDQISTLLDKLKTEIQAAKEAGKDSTIDLCKVTVKGTNLFCTESKGIPRSQMPQLKAYGVSEDSKAWKEGIHTDDGEIDIQPLFLQRLKDEGFTADVTPVLASHLRASQNQLNAGKVAGITDFVLNGGGAEKIGSSAVFVSSDNYIVDGHHRWASLVSADYADGDGDDLTMDVWKIDIDIITLLQKANDFAAEYGIGQMSVSANLNNGCIGCGTGLTYAEVNAMMQARRQAQKTGSSTSRYNWEPETWENGHSVLIKGALEHPFGGPLDLFMAISPIPETKSDLSIRSRFKASKTTPNWEANVSVYSPSYGPVTLGDEVSQKSFTFHGTTAQAKTQCEKIAQQLLTDTQKEINQ